MPSLDPNYGNLSKLEKATEIKGEEAEEQARWRERPERATGSM